MMTLLLKTLNYEAVPVRNITDALSLIQTEHFDLCILNVAMPAEDGFKLCDRIRQTGLEIPVIFVSGYARETDKHQGLKAGASAYLTKPVGYEELQVTIARFLPSSL